MSLDLERLDAVATVAAIRDGSVSPAEYAEALADRVSQHSELNAIQSFDREHAVRAAVEAHAADPHAALAGLPVVAKHNINTTNYPTSGGTKWDSWLY